MLHTDRPGTPARRGRLALDHIVTSRRMSLKFSSHQWKMPYLSQSGQVLDSRSPWRLSIIPEMFWGFINIIILFFRTMISPDLTNKGSGYSSDYRQGLTGNSRGPRGPPPPPRRRMGGFGARGTAPAPPPAAGGG